MARTQLTSKEAGRGGSNMSTWSHRGSWLLEAGRRTHDWSPEGGGNLKSRGTSQRAGDRVRPPSERLWASLRFGAEDEDFLGLSALESTLLSGVDSDFNLPPVYRPHPWAGDSWGPPFPAITCRFQEGGACARSSMEGLCAHPKLISARHTRPL